MVTLFFFARFILLLFAVEHFWITTDKLRTTGIEDMKTALAKPNNAGTLKSVLYLMCLSGCMSLCVCVEESEGEL